MSSIIICLCETKRKGSDSMERLIISELMAKRLKELADFIEAFEISYEELGSEYMQENDAKAIERVVDLLRDSVKALRRASVEYRQNVGVAFVSKINKVLGAIPDKIDSGLATVCIGEGATQFRGMINGLLKNECKSISAILGEVLGKILQPHYGTDRIAFIQIKKIVATLTMALKNNPKCLMTQRLVDLGYIEYKRDAVPEFPTVDTGWEYKSRLLNAFLTELYSVDNPTVKEER